MEKTGTSRDPGKIRSLFDSIAPDYDRLNHILSCGTDRSWRRRALKEALVPGKAQQILDLACGTGDFSLALARKASEGSHIYGVDLSEGMLKEMRKKVAAAGSKRYRRDGAEIPYTRIISSETGDAESLRFADCTFDSVTIAFGIRNFAHREAALREILRVLKPGGRLVILELSVPTNDLLSRIYKFYINKFIPWIGGVISGDKAAYRYLPASIIAFPGQAEWMTTMECCGFGNVRHKAFTCGICRMYIGEK